MRTKLIERASAAYSYPLLIKHLLHTPLHRAPEQEIVYRGLKRYDYRMLRRRIGQLATGLTQLGVGPGDTVAVMDWDSHRYLECYFAAPMMGAALHTINIRLSPEQILYTINHAEDDVILVHADFLPLLEAIKDQIRRVKKFVVLTDDEAPPDTTLEVAPEYEAMLEASDEDYEFPTSTRIRSPRSFTPPALRARRRASISATVNWRCTPSPAWRLWLLRSRNSVSTRAMSICRSRRCSMCMPGGCRTSRRSWESSRFIRGVTRRMRYW